MDGAAPAVGTCSSRAVAHQAAPGAGMSSVLELPCGTSSVLTCAGEQPLYLERCGPPNTPPAPQPCPCSHLCSGGASSAPQHPGACPCPLLHTGLGPGEGLTMWRACWLLPRPHICRGKAGDKLEAGTPWHPAGPAQATSQPHGHHGVLSMAQSPCMARAAPLGLTALQPQGQAQPGTAQPGTAWHRENSPSAASGASRLSSRSSSAAASLPSMGPSPSSSPSGSVGQGHTSAWDPPSPWCEQHRDTALVQRGQPGPRAGCSSPHVGGAEGSA